jgi:hypothetical protein
VTRYLAIDVKCAHCAGTEPKPEWLERRAKAQRGLYDVPVPILLCSEACAEAYKQNPGYWQPPRRDRKRFW